MSESHNVFGQSLSIDAALRVDEACDRFEAAWKSGPAPRVEDFVRTVERARAALLCELLRLDIVYRKQRGNSPTPAEYLTRFPHDAGIVAVAFTLPQRGDASAEVAEVTTRPGPVAETMTDPNATTPD